MRTVLWAGLSSVVTAFLAPSFLGRLYDALESGFLYFNGAKSFFTTKGKKKSVIMSRRVGSRQKMKKGGFQED